MTQRLQMASPDLQPRSVSVVVPVYNSAPTLPELVSRLESTLSTVTECFEVVLVNDGSSDGSRRVLSELAQSHGSVRTINLMRNYGQHNALLCGIRAARHPVVVTLDDDLQHPPEEIPNLLRKLDEGYDVVFGTPARRRHGLWRHLASQVTKLVLQGAMGAEAARQISAFRAFRLDLREAFAHYEAPFVCLDVLLTWGTSSFATVPVRHERRAVGESGYSFRQLVRHALTMTTGFSTLPLQLASGVGFLFTVFGVGVLAFVLSRYFIQGDRVPGFPFLASVIAIFSGAQLFAMGIMGEYLARMHFRMMDRPTYVIRDVSGPAGRSAGATVSAERDAAAPTPPTRTAP